MSGVTAEEVLERSSECFESYLWNSDGGKRVRGRIAQWGIEEQTLRSFRIGYAPGNAQLFLRHLEHLDVSPADLLGAGMASESGRGHLHVRFHARIMFPVRNATGLLCGFAGLATHLGPSWPLWLASPEDGPFEAGAALFGIEKARTAIGRGNRALVVRDCAQVLALHQDGRDDAVAVVQSPITRTHTAQLASALSAGDIDFARRDGYLGVVAVPAGDHVPLSAFASRATPSGFTLVHSDRDPHRVRTAGSPPADLDDLVSAARSWVYLTGGLIGFGVPVLLLLIAAPGEDENGGTTSGLNVVIVGVATVYLVSALLISRISARTRDRTRSRRMREPWARGSGEVQPAGWTYHRMEEILVGAALVSAAICLVLLMTVGGFLG